MTIMSFQVTLQDSSRMNDTLRATYSGEREKEIPYIRSVPAALGSDAIKVIDLILTHLGRHRR